VAATAAAVLFGCGFSGSSGGGGSDPDAGLDATADAPGEETLVFRRGDGTTVLDTWLFESDPEDDRGDFPTMVIDSVFREGTGPNGESIGVLRFDFLGESLDLVPEDASIEAAELVLVIENLSGGDQGGDPAELFFALVDWDESTTWDSMGEDAGVDPDVDYEDRVVGVIGNSVGAVAGTEIAIDVRGAVGGWVDGEAENRGWVLRMPEDNSNGVRFFTSDAPAIESRPRLTVTFRRP
jgi:hypothetical protein